jgi:thiol-disulfide isomerase/thioredoxin
VPLALFSRIFLSELFNVLFTRRVMRRLLFSRSTLACVLLIAPLCRAQRVPTVYGYDMNGQPVTRLASSGTEAVVLFFVASDCPISNRYVPEIRKLEEKFAAQHVVFWLVYPNVGETSSGVRQHEATYGSEEHILLDPDHRLVAFTHAKLTPESAILVPEHSDAETFRAVYHGRIDDRYVQFGQERPKATQHDLERAIGDVLKHRSVEQANGPAVGCGIIGRP